MSRKQYTKLTVAVTAPVPAGMTQAAFVAILKDLAAQHFGNSATVRLTQKEVVYL